ncbi:hypothetical protein CDIK_1102 [Cucumispora dikerogammari]|nr:hypothetical protein CDIK_1102 [Cucumispora dikerogammari]
MFYNYTHFLTFDLFRPHIIKHIKDIKTEPEPQITRSPTIEQRLVKRPLLSENVQTRKIYDVVFTVNFNDKYTADKYGMYGSGTHRNHEVEVQACDISKDDDGQYCANLDFETLKFNMKDRLEFERGRGTSMNYNFRLKQLDNEESNPIIEYLAKNKGKAIKIKLTLYTKAGDSNSNIVLESPAARLEVSNGTLFSDHIRTRNTTKNATANNLKEIPKDFIHSSSYRNKKLSSKTTRNKNGFDNDASRSTNTYNKHAKAPITINNDIDISSVSDQPILQKPDQSTQDLPLTPSADQPALKDPRSTYKNSENKPNNYKWFYWAFGGLLACVLLMGVVLWVIKKQS